MLQEINEVLSEDREYLPTVSIKSLVDDHIYKVTNFTKVQTRYGLKIVVDLDSLCSIFLTDTMSKKIFDQPKRFVFLDETCRKSKLYMKKFEDNKINFITSEEMQAGNCSSVTIQPIIKSKNMDTKKKTNRKVSKTINSSLVILY